MGHQSNRRPGSFSSQSSETFIPDKQAVRPAAGTVRSHRYSPHLTARQSNSNTSCFEKSSGLITRFRSFFSSCRDTESPQHLPLMLVGAAF
jgi:hypothetical protein